MRARGSGIFEFSAAAVLWLWSGGVVCAESPQSPASPKDLKELHEKMDRQLERMLEPLKTIDPKGYERRRAQLERQQQIRAIVAAFTDKQLDLAAARARLKPLVQAEAESRQGMLETQITLLRKQLEELEASKRDPATYVQQQVDRYLGLVPPPGMGAPAAPPAASPTAGVAPPSVSPAGRASPGKVVIKERGKSRDAAY